MCHFKHIIKCQLNPIKCGKPSHILLITIVILLSVPLDAFHDKSGIKKGLCSRTFYVGDFKLIIQGVLGLSYYRNPINTAVSPVRNAAVWHCWHCWRTMQMEGFGGRRSSGTITIYWYIKICAFMSDHFFFNSGTVSSVPLTEFTAAATCCYSLCFLLMVIPIPLRPNKTTFRASTSPTSVSTSTSGKFCFFAFLCPAIVSDKT